MKINPIIAANNNIQPKIFNPQSKLLRISSSCETTPNCNAYYMPFVQNMPKTIVFSGKIVHIVDGGIHADNMKHFMHAMKNSAEIKMHDVEINSKDIYTKQLKSVEEQLIKLNKASDDYSSEFIALPVLAQVPFLNIQDQYKRVMGEGITLTPENVKANKSKLLLFLKQIYNYPEVYRKYTGYMDPILQGVEYSYGIIQEINKLVAKKAKVYLPAGHPNDLTIKWMAGKQGLKPELYHYIATGEDVNEEVAKMLKGVKDNNWYSFNLLVLSDAKIVGLKGADWKEDYIFSSYDSCINDSARGVYNLIPIRENDKVVGFSYTGNSNDYPYEEFPLLSKVKNLLPFVGKYKHEVLASKSEVKLGLDKNKLYKVEDIFSPYEIKKNKIKIRGRYVDGTKKLFFDENKEGKIIFRNCDCERSETPSVMPIWGTCYAALNAIARDINLEERSANSIGNYRALLNNGINALASRNLKDAETYYERADAIAKSIFLRNDKFMDLYCSAEKLGDIYYKKGDLDGALGCYNSALDTLANYFKKYSKSKSIDVLKQNYEKYNNYKRVSDIYDSELRKYNHLSMFSKLFAVRPLKPLDYGKHKELQYAKDEYDAYVLKFAGLYENIANICKQKGEIYAAKVCEAAVSDIKMCTSRGKQIINKRADKIQFIGDLYSEIKPD